MVIAELLTVDKIWKQPNCPLIDEQIKLYPYTGVLFSFKKEENLPFVTTWMDLEDIMLSEISLTQKDTYFVISLIYRF